MKRLICVLLILLFIPVLSLANLPDISSLDFDELVSLRDQLNMAIWNSKEWQKIEVSPGTWQIGKDIPAGHWTILPFYDTLCNITYFNLIDKYGRDPAVGWEGWQFMIADASKYKDWQKYAHQCDAVLEDGMYLYVSSRVYFTPYAGGPDFGFQ